MTATEDYWESHKTGESDGITSYTFPSSGSSDYVRPPGGYGYVEPTNSPSPMPTTNYGTPLQTSSPSTGIQTSAPNFSSGSKSLGKTTVTTPRTQYLPTSQTGVSESWTEYSGESPEYEKMEYDTGRIDTLAQQFGGRYTRKAREGLLQAITGINTSGVDNPIARASMYRQAMSGYSEGLSAGMSEAQQRAVQQYNTQFSAEAGQHKLEFEADTRAYERTGKQTGTQSQTTSYTPSYKLSPLWNEETQRLDTSQVIDKSNWTDFQKGIR